ncbi:pyridoxal phosphate-dependent aminotransferase [Halalkalicoccus jeotgali]|uniref:Aminotransferase n=1 Tax=Halalkalicoccus jeotgali (strain DSM 18796 / CECT 7217 / JCM 14584 / KCTC 4019 / B3) TaxID=795797 RepID=D8J6Q0_HALJB|nr:pyridoxal phosphate-dependent aminotransferase [Halalkalicoccus jeotgali]ADJ13927.1 aminotransferase class I and II [Halalkalicoccus jeotgali B3]ELY34030.1 class I and II aminotransferase [Halalkalicoccus jeotgali B3]
MADPAVSNRVAGIEPQQIRRLFDLASDHDADDIVHLELGEPDFPTPAHVIDAAAVAARDGETNYTPNAGIDSLRRAIADRLRADGVDADPDRVVVTTGGVEALYLTLLTVTDPGDEVVVPTPAWPNPLSQARLAGATPVPVPLSPADGFAFDADRIIDTITDRTGAVIVTSPSNPTGRVFDTAAMERVVDAAARHDAYVIADEVYHELTYDRRPDRLAAVTDHPERVVTIDSCSKTYSMTGWRVGWLSGPKPVTTAVTKIHESTTSCVNTPAQYAAVAALTGTDAPVREMQAAFEYRRDAIVDRLDAIPAVSAPRPEGAFYAFVDVSALSGSSMEIAQQLLFEYDVVAAPGSAFGPGGEEYLRFSFANDLDRIERGLDRFEQLVRDEGHGA